MHRNFANSRDEVFQDLKNNFFYELFFKTVFIVVAFDELSGRIQIWRCVKSWVFDPLNLSRSFYQGPCEDACGEGIGNLHQHS